MRKTTIAVLGVALLGAGGVGGCTNYYKVHDPTTGRDYYTTELTHQNSGAATLKDARTGNRVNLQNSEVSKVSKEQFESGKNTAPATPATPATPASAAPAASDAPKAADANPFK
jgi:hypothetical protein